MFKETLTDTDVENLIVHMQPHDFKAWVTSPDRTDVDFANLVKLARALGKAGVLEDDSPLSQFSINTFWQDMATTFPRMIGYVMLLPTIEERKRVRDSLKGLEVSTGPPCSPIPHYPTLSHIIPHYPTLSHTESTDLHHIIPPLTAPPCSRSMSTSGSFRSPLSWLTGSERSDVRRYYISS